MGVWGARAEGGWEESQNKKKIYKMSTTKLGEGRFCLTDAAESHCPFLYGFNWFVILKSLSENLI